MVIDNSCTPQNVYGPYEQTLFLGCSILNFTASAGWNGQTSELTVDLAQDDCAVRDGGSPKKYWAQGDKIFTSAQSWTKADPGFTYPNIGAPAYFRVADFEFAGLIQAWTEKKGADGLPAFSVKLVDPRPILDHAKIILDSYQGTNLVGQTVGGSIRLHNIFNVYSYLEEKNSTITANDDFSTGVGLGSPVQRIGGSYKTEGGISWSLVKKALRDLLGGPPVNPAPNFSTGGITYIDGQNLDYSGDNASRGGEIYMGTPDGAIRYIVDLDELPDPYTWDYRITGPVISLSQIIDQVCNDAGVDYYVELLPTANAKGSTQIAELVIKIRTISRINQPTLGASGGGEISSFIESNSIENGGQGIIANSFGRELRTDINSSFIIGAKARQYYEENSSSYIEPYWGLDADGNLIQSDYDDDDGGYSVRLDFSKINISLTHPVVLDLINGRYGWVYETQLRFALGDYDSFVNNLLLGDGSTVLEKYFATTLERISSNVKLRANANTGQMAVDNPPGTTSTAGRPDDPRTISAKAVHQWLNTFASEYYGRQFLVSIPSVSYAAAGTTWTETSEIITKPVYTDEPSTEGGWPSTLSYPNTLVDVSLRNSQTYLTEKTSILGIANPSTASDFFKDEQGKVQPILKFSVDNSSGLGLDRLGLDDYVSVSGSDSSIAWVKAEIDEQWVIGNPRVNQSAASYNYVSALLTIPAIVIDNNTVPALATNTPLGDAQLATDPPTLNVNVTNNTGKTLGGQGVSVNAVAPAPVKPSNAGVPLISNTRTYGPWVMMGANPGSVNCEVDEGLAPWEYGSIDYMNAAGVAKVQNSVTSLQVGERGEVTVPGYPIISLGSALESNPRSFRFKDRELRYYTQQWPSGPVAIRFVAGEAYTQYINNSSATRVSVGSSVSNISISVGAGGVTTSYTVNTFTPVFGRFSKNNAERIKNLGLRRFSSEKEMRARSAMKSMMRASAIRAIAGKGGAGGVSEDMGKGATAPRSPSIWFAGKVLEDGKRKVILAPTSNTMTYYEEYDNTSIVTMDNFYRPASLYGGGGSGELAGSGLTMPKVNVQGDTTTYNEYRLGGYAVGERVVVSGTGYLANTAVRTTSMGDLESYNSGKQYPAGAIINNIAGGCSNIYRAFVSNINRDPCVGANSIYWENLTSWMGSPAAFTIAGTFNLSKWDVISTESVSTNAPTQTTSPPPPLVEYSGLPIRQKYLDYLGDPYQNTGLFDDSRNNSSTSGHDIEGVARKTIPWITGNQTSGNNSLLIHSVTDPTGNYANDYRLLAHRGPLMVHGWGYDIHGKPIPNASGDESAHLGDFTTSYAGLSDKFKTNWLSDARDWPVAPVDLRFDRKRGVWTIPPAFRMYQVESVNGAEAGGTGTFSVLKHKADLADADGNLISSPTITAENWSDISISKTEKNVAYYDSPSSSYWLLNAGGGKVIPGVAVSGTPAVYAPNYRTFKDGCIFVWPLTTPSGFDATLSYASNDRVVKDIAAFDASTVYNSGDLVRFTGDGPSCPNRTYIAPTGSPAQAFSTGVWTASGCSTRTQYINSGLSTIGPGSFSLDSGWLALTGTTYVDTGCMLTWSHGMVTSPVQGHYVEGGAGNDILVWYDCDIIKGWTNL